MASFSGRCRSLRNGGSTRMVHGRSRLACRPARPSGPNERTVTRPALLSPRLSGASVVPTATRPPGGTVSFARPVACRLGCQASRRTPRSGRRPGFVTVRLTMPCWPSRMRVSPEREISSLRTLAARATSVPMATAIKPSTSTRPAVVRRASAASVATTATRAARPVTTICAATGERGRRRARFPARRRSSLRPVPLLAAAGSGA
jgi:hypothetical protein